MNTQEFIDGIKTVVVDGSIESLQSNLVKPAGRMPAKKLVLISEWYNKLSQIDKDMVMEIVKESVDASVFGFLCVFDGVREIEVGEKKGNLRLYYGKEGKKQLLNNPDGEYLHDLFNR
jgi:hypothetical protein